MFRPMRRFKRQLSKEECEKILIEATSGVLAVHGDDGYSCLQNFREKGGYFFTAPGCQFHQAVTGHKVDALRNNDKVSFCVIAQDEVMPKERTTAYISVIAFGRARFLDDEEGLRYIAGLVGEKYSKDYPDLVHAEIDDSVRRKSMTCVEVTIEHMTGKAGREVFKKREAQHRSL